MKRVITISREFGSGGRELGKRLADEMHLPVYDHEIIEMLAEQHHLDPAYISAVSERTASTGYTGYAATIGRRFTVRYPAADQQLKLIRDQEQLIRDLASSECIIVGRAADIILSDMTPFNIFVYADRASKVERCLERAGEDEHLTQEEMLRKMKKVDRQRASYHGLFADTVWGARENYALCINTSRTKIAPLVGPLAAYIEAWYEGRDSENVQSTDHE